MLHPPYPKADVGVIIGRFQVHELHEAHRELIDSVCQNHARVIVLVGQAPLRCKPRNPLNYEVRRRMLQYEFPDIDVYPITDRPNDFVWSREVDELLDYHLKPGQTAALYGGRDSFTTRYHGKWPTCELESNTHISGEELRRRISVQYPPTTAFRAGIIAAAYDQFPTSYTVVDVAILDRPNDRVLLGRKSAETQFRFIGGFTDPRSPNLEHDAAREVLEETGVEVAELTYVSNRRIDDWRYRNEVDKILSVFFVGTWIYGVPRAGDDIAEVLWFTLSRFQPEQLVEEHRPFLNDLRSWLTRHNPAHA